MFNLNFLQEVKSLYPDATIDRIIDDQHRIFGYHIKRGSWTFSVMFGYGNYCDYYVIQPLGPEVFYTQSKTAEIAAWPTQNSNYDCWVSYEHDKVKGYLSPEEVLCEMIDLFG